MAWKWWRDKHGREYEARPYVPGEDLDGIRVTFPVDDSFEDHHRMVVKLDGELVLISGNQWREDHEYPDAPIDA